MRLEETKIRDETLNIRPKFSASKTGNAGLRDKVMVTENKDGSVTALMKKLF